MLRKPPGKRVRAPVRQHVHQFTTFEIHQDGSATESEVVHTQYPGCSVDSKPRRTNVVEQGVSRDHDPEVSKKTRSRFPSEGEGDVREPSLEPLGSASIVPDD